MPVTGPSWAMIVAVLGVSSEFMSVGNSEVSQVRVSWRRIQHRRQCV